MLFCYNFLPKKIQAKSLLHKQASRDFLRDKRVFVAKYASCCKDNGKRQW